MTKSIKSGSRRNPDADAAAWVLRLADGELPDAAMLAAWRQWLDSDPTCRAAFTRAFEVWQALGADVPWLGAMAREARIDLERRRQRHDTRSPLWWLAAACFVLVLIVGSASWWYATAPVTYTTGVGERRTVQLEDGSRISLDADTRVSVAYSRDQRRLQLLRGRVACEVAKDPLRPFSVRAADKVVVATGTEFSVELVSDQVRVILYRGHVAVLNTDVQLQPVLLQDSKAVADAMLKPGREMVMSVHRKSAVVSSIEPSQTLSWEHGQLYFDDEPLALAVQRVNRYARAPIAIAGAAAAQTRISGVFTAGDTKAFISGVTAVFPIRAVERNGVRTLVIRPP